MVVFCQNLGITAYTLKKYYNFKSKFSFNNGNIFEDDYDYYMIILELGEMSDLMICLN